MTTLAKIREWELNKLAAIAEATGGTLTNDCIASVEFTIPGNSVQYATVNYCPVLGEVEFVEFDGDTHPRGKAKTYYGDNRAFYRDVEKWQNTVKFPRKIEVAA